MNGFIAYEGPSVFDGAPIAGIVTLNTRNRKTGPLAQLAIIRADIDPVAAHRIDADKSIRGTCPLRKNADGKRACYVILHQMPLSIYKAYKRGSYPRLEDHPELLNELKDRPLRVGSYGDPVAIPFSKIEPLIEAAPFITGYTHAWRHGRSWRWKGILQASVETIPQAERANMIGWNTFRVMPPGEQPRGPQEILCRNEADGKQCAECRLCNGNKANVCIHVHGAGARNFPTKKAPNDGNR